MMGTEKLTNKIDNTLYELRNKHNEWDLEKRNVDLKLYSLLEDCLNIFYEIKNDSVKRDVFEKIYGTKEANRISLEARIIKSVFGDDVKKLRTYVKLLKAAAKNKVGLGGNATMSQWLEEQGGVKDAIKTGSEHRWEAWRKLRILVGKNSERFGVKYKGGDLHSKTLSQISDESFAIIVTPNKENNSLKVNATTNNSAALDRIFDEFGSHIIGSRGYRKNISEFLEYLKVEEDEETLQLLDVLKDDLKRLSNPRLE